MRFRVPAKSQGPGFGPQAPGSRRPLSYSLQPTAYSLFACLCLFPATAAATGPFGAGLIIGEPSGLSFKLFADEQHAFDAALDFSVKDDAFYVHADYLWHFSPLKSPDARDHTFLPYAGVGGRLKVADRGKNDDDARVGARFPIGIAWLPPRVPVDVFLEIVPGIDIIEETNPRIGAGLGARYFF